MLLLLLLKVFLRFTLHKIIIIVLFFLSFSFSLLLLSFLIFFVRPSLCISKIIHFFVSYENKMSSEALESISTDDLMREVQRRIDCATKPEKRVILIGASFLFLLESRQIFVSSRSRSCSCSSSSFVMLSRQNHHHRQQHHHRMRTDDTFLAIPQVHLDVAKARKRRKSKANTACAT